MRVRGGTRGDGTQGVGIGGRVVGKGTVRRWEPSKRNGSGFGGWKPPVRAMRCCAVRRPSGVNEKLEHPVRG